MQTDRSVADVIHNLAMLDQHAAEDLKVSGGRLYKRHFGKASTTEKAKMQGLFVQARQKIDELQSMGNFANLEILRRSLSKAARRQHGLLPLSASRTHVKSAHRGKAEMEGLLERSGVQSVQLSSPQKIGSRFAIQAQTAKRETGPLAWRDKFLKAGGQG